MIQFAAAKIPIRMPISRTQRDVWSSNGSSSYEGVDVRSILVDIARCVGGGTDFEQIVVERDEFLVLQMAAAFGEGLILDMDSGNT